jgi:putative peptidoglycan lipid II flippase
MVGAALIVMSGFMASRVLGLVRNVVIGSQYGATRDYEAYLAAISVPDTIFQVLAGGTVGAAYIPVFAAYLAEGDRAKAWRLTSSLINLALVGVGAVAVVLAFLAPQVMGLLVAGWSPEDQQLAARLARIMMISPVIFAVSSLITSTLNAEKRFALAAFAPLAYNLSLIVGAIVTRPFGIEGLAMSAVVGALLHLAVQLPGLFKVGMQYLPTFGLDLAGTREVARLMGPRVIGLGISQFNQLVNVGFASFLIQGSVAYLNYAWLILMAPLGIVAMGFSTAIFPTLAEQSAQNEVEEEQQTFLFGLRMILYLAIPAAVGLIVLGLPAVELLLQRGAFGPEDTLGTWSALAFFALGLPGHAVIEIVNRVFYAERDTATPVKVGAAAVALNIGLSLILMNVGGLSFRGLALANSIAALTESTILTLLLQRRMRWMRLRELFGFGWRVSLAAFSMGMVAIFLHQVLLKLTNTDQWYWQALILVVVGAVAIISYLGSSIALGIEDARRVVQLFRRR